MALDRWIAVFFLLICLVYGYTAFFMMDGSLPPFMKRNPIWPSTFPKMLSVLGMLAALTVLVTAKEEKEPDESAINYRRLGDYNVGQALFLMGLMVAYAVCLRPVGFLSATTLFLFIGGYLLGERRYHILIPVAVIASGTIWYLVQEVLGIFLRPLPWFIGG